MLYLTGIYLFLVLSMTIYMVWKVKDKVMLFLFAAICLVSYVAFADLLGRPRPTEVAIGKEYQLVSYLVRQDKIYVWVLAPGSLEPLSLFMDYDPKTAKNLREVEENIKKGGVVMRRPIELHAPWEFHPRTHQELPPKTIQ